MKLNKTMRKFLAVVLSLALVVSSIAINSSTSKAADGDFSISIGELAWKNETDTIKSFSVSFSAVTGDGATYDDSKLYYRIYIDAVSDDNAAINYSAGWNWIENIVTYGNDDEGFSNNHLFDGVFTTASGFNAGDKNASTVLEAGSEHEVILAAYATRTDASANENAVATASKAFTVPAEIETTTVADAETVVNIEVAAEIDANNGITASWTHPAGMESYAQEYYLGTAEEVIEDQAHWARNGTADWVWGNASGRQNVDNVVATNDRTMNVANGGDYVVRVIYKDANGVIVARGTSPVITFEKNVNLDMSAFQERNVELTAYLKWTRVTGAASYKVYDTEGTLVKDNVVADWADVNLAAYNTEYEYTIKAYDSDGVEIEGVTNNVVKAIVKDENYVETTTDEPSSEEPSLYPAAVGTHEAENAAQVNFTKTPETGDYYASCSGGSIVGVSAEWINNAKKYISQQVNAAEAGKYQLTLQYCAPKAVEFMIQVNDSEWTYFDEVADVVGHVSPSTGGWNVVGTVTTEIELTEGVNTINISGPVVDNSTEDGNFFTVYENSWNNSSSANLDCFTISKIEEEPSSDEPSSDEPSSEDVTTTPGYDPGFNPAELTYTNIVCDGNADLSIDYSVQSSTVNGVTPWYGDNGVVFQIAHQNEIATEILVNGQAPAEGFVGYNAKGIVKLNPTLLADNAYSVITVKTEDGAELTLVIKKGTPVVEEPSSEESSSEEPSSEEPSSEEPSSDEPSSDVPEVEYTQLENNGTVYVDSWELYNAGYEWGSGNSWLAYAGTTDDDLAIKVVASSGDSNSWELQAKKANASIYEGLEVGKTYKVITTLDSTEAGAILSKLEGFNEGNTYPIVAGTNKLETIITYTGTPDGSAVLALSGMPAGTVISNVTYTFEETEAPPETTTEEPTADAEGFVEVKGADADITGLGNWGMWMASTHTMKIKVDEADSDHIQSRLVSNNGNWDVWSAQYKISKYGLTPGAEYTMCVDVKGDSADFAPTAGGVDYNADKTLTEVTVEMTCTADENGAIEGIVGIGVVGIGVTLDLSNIVVKDAEGNVVEVLDKAPEVETTTPEEPSSDEKPSSDVTTEAPTTEAPTTVVEEPTTKKIVVKRTKVKSATKKAASKKIKISIKKVKGAKGYRVQISTNKKFKKKLVNKIVKKRKVTIKSKKIKNKKKLYVRVKAYKLDGTKKVWAKKWSKAKKVNIKK